MKPLEIAIARSILATYFKTSCPSCKTEPKLLSEELAPWSILCRRCGFSILVTDLFDLSSETQIAPFMEKMLDEHLAEGPLS